MSQKGECLYKKLISCINSLLKLSLIVFFKVKSRGKQMNNMAKIELPSRCRDL